MHMNQYKKENEIRPKQKPKPTHHVIIPKKEKITSLNIKIGENSEQEMIKTVL